MMPPRSRTPKKGVSGLKEATVVYAVPSLTKVTRHGQITLPSELRIAMEIEEGDLIEVRMQEDQIVLIPKRLVDKSQAYFWTKDCQADEAEAEADIKAGRVKSFDSAEALLQELND